VGKRLAYSLICGVKRWLGRGWAHATGTGLYKKNSTSPRCLSKHQLVCILFASGCWCIYRTRRSQAWSTKFFCLQATGKCLWAAFLQEWIDWCHQDGTLLHYFIFLLAWLWVIHSTRCNSNVSNFLKRGGVLKRKRKLNICLQGVYQLKANTL